MNRFAFALASLATLTLSACVSPAPFTVVIENDSEAIRYVDATFGMAALDLAQDGAWTRVSENTFCARKCGEPGLDVMCLEAAPAPQVLALEPGESVEVEFDGDGWITPPGMSCVIQTSHRGDARIQVCHGSEVDLWDDVEPADDGVITGDLLDSQCESVETEIEEGSEVEFTLRAE